MRMVLYSLLQALLLLNGICHVANAHGGHDHGGHNHGEGYSCSTPDPDPATLAFEQAKMDALRELKLMDHNAGNGQRSLLDGTESVSIDTYFHILMAPDGTGDVNDETIDQQMKVLNQGYSETPFQFVLKATNRVVNEKWFSDAFRFMDEYKAALRIGDESTLNIYFGDLGDPMLGRTTLFGLATFPSAYSFQPILDGVAINYRTVPGGSIEHFNEGKVATHEVGHWMGLLHTFQGRSCEGEGDYVNDTPFHAVATEGCPTGTGIDTCPGRDGLDPIENFMDYSFDICKTTFSPGQIERMYSQWLLYRKQDEVCPAGQALFELQMQFDSNPKETSWTLNTMKGDEVLRSPVPPTLLEWQKAAGTLLVKDICIASGTYMFTINDFRGNGLTEGGSYKITVDGGVVKEGATFTFSESTEFVVDGGIIPVTTPPIVGPVAVTVPPTAAPAAPSVAPGSTVAIVVFIAFDFFPNEIGWSLVCGSSVLANVDDETYPFLDFSYGSIIEIFEVPIGEECVFTIIDSFGDGMECLSDEECGFYAVIVDDAFAVPPTLFEGASSDESFLAVPPAPTTDAPTMLASSAPSAPPTANTVLISILIVMDSYPEEIAFSLSCDGTNIFEPVPYSTFAGDGVVINETYDVPDGSNCIFTIMDSFGDGLFCLSKDDCGFYALIYGDDFGIDENLIAVNFFEDGEDVVNFIA